MEKEKQQKPDEKDVINHSEKNLALSPEGVALAIGLNPGFVNLIKGRGKSE